MGEVSEVQDGGETPCRAARKVGKCSGWAGHLKALERLSSFVPCRASILGQVFLVKAQSTRLDPRNRNRLPKGFERDAQS